MAKGDDATAGIEERDIESHRFPPDPINNRRVQYQGEYILVFNEETEEQRLLEEKVGEYKPFDVPKGFTTYIRGCKRVCFDKT
ncbi:hypothetical protein B0I35DRAFT_446194 [Stachybotrys elegans]|uniref:Uncharacterized protein n=1 Tax=Stachybotrys elegans TaxID=80388 RepID=A0A8K0SGG9_9HYPO|nr:hypothetical protein B0I35DRAFT_446194 [Stachybotrys elegans]